MVKRNIIITLRSKLSFLTKTQTTILSAASILGLTSGITALLGLIKSRLLTTFFGISHDLTVFYTADKIPNLLYSLFVVGVLSTVFIPLYADALKKGEDEAHKTASMIMNLGLVFFGLFGGLAFIFAKPLINLLSVYQFTPEEVQLGVNLMRIMLGAQIFLLLGSSITSVAHTHDYFLLPSLAPVIYNLGMILGIIFLAEKAGIYGPTYGIVIGSGAHFLIQLPLLRKIRFRYKPRLDLKNAYMRKIYVLAPPRFISVLINTLMNTIYNSLAILISKPSVIYLKFADQLQSFPINLFGASIAAAALPALSKKTALRDTRKFKKIFLSSLHQMLYFTLPCSVLLLVLRVPIIRIVYGATRFPWESTVKTSYTLAFFSLSIFSQSATILITRAFYARSDTKTPLFITGIFAPINLALSITFIQFFKWGAWSLAFAYSITSFMEAVVLLNRLGASLGGFGFKKLVTPFLKIGYSAAFMGLGLYIPLKILDQYVFDTTKTLQLLIITGTASLIGIGSYYGLTELFQVEELRLIKTTLTKKLKRKQVTSGMKINTLAEIEN